MTKFYLEFSKEKEEYIGCCKEYPDKKFIDKDPGNALTGILNLVKEIELERK